MKTDQLTTVALDLGGTYCRAAIVDSSGEILTQVKNKVDHDIKKPEIILESIEEIVGEYKPQNAVVGVPGIVDYESQQTVFYPNLPDSWKRYLTANWIARNLGIEVSLANDADMAAVGEARFGAGKYSRDIVYVTISTGVGGAAILGGKLVHGKFAANDVGHIIVDLCNAIEGNSKPYTPETSGAGPYLEQAASNIGLDVSAEELLNLVRSGDQEATEVFTKALRGTAAGIVNLAWLYAPQTVVIGGGVGLNNDLVHPIVKDMLKRFGPSGVGDIEVACAELGDDAAIKGAAAWWAAFS